ncbi:MAG: response regulator transcription factor [Caldilineaceae bacterium]
MSRGWPGSFAEIGRRCLCRGCDRQHADALDWVQSADYDMVLLDIMLPGMDGLAVCRQLRDHGYTMPILMLTALGTLPDKVSGLDSGAMIIWVRAFAIQELTARLRALAPHRCAEKRHPAHRRSAAGYGGQAGGSGDRHIELTAKEYALLETLMRNPNRVLSRDQLIDHIWNMDFAAESKLIEVYIYNLRKKIDDGFDQKLIQTVRGLGYRMVDHAEAA